MAKIKGEINLQEGCLDFYSKKGCCLICDKQEPGCWCDDCMCHYCYWYKKLENEKGGVCEHLRTKERIEQQKTSENANYGLVFVEGTYKLRYGKKHKKFLNLGTIRKDGFFKTYRTKNTVMRIHQGFGLNAQLLKDLSKKYPDDCRGICILYEGQKLYYSTPKEWFEKGIPYKNTIYPYDDQIHLKAKYMIEKDGGKK